MMEVLGVQADTTLRPSEVSGYHSLCAITKDAIES